ncbi:MAG: hypothetical protein IJY84_02210 [Clostridia bacterium]|nr:hypothetical protein [Clostridia bacterium]
MSKKRVNILKVLLCFVLAVCLFGGLGTIKDVTLAEQVASEKWIAPYHQLTALEDTETGMTQLPIANYGERMYYKEKLTLDGLTVTIGSSNMVASSRFGVGFTNVADNYTPESGPFNITVVPSLYSGQDCVFFNSSHADGTIVYTADTFAQGVCNVDGSVVNRFISAPSLGVTPEYSITFKYMGLFTPDPSYGNYWQATIVLEKGTPFRSNLTSATIAFLDSSLNGILDANGQCYLSAFGMSGAGAFYVGLVTAEQKALLAAADTALANYETARQSGASVIEARRNAVNEIESLPDDYKADYLARLEEIDALEGNWIPAFNTCESAIFDATTGYSTLNPNAWGERMYYTSKVKLDGLTVTIGSTNMNAGARFGFGFTNNTPTTDGNYTPQTGPFNVNIVPSEVSGQDCLYLNRTHESGTIVYTADTFDVGVCRVDDQVVNRFISAPSAETRYSVTFEYMGLFTPAPSYGNYWQATITLEEGNAFRDGLTSATVAFLESSLNGILDAEGECYISAWGMGNGAFYMGVQDAVAKRSIQEAAAAEEAYKNAIISGENVEETKAAYLAIIENLPSNESVAYAKSFSELGLQEVALKNVSHSASVTVSDSLSLNYKISVPEICEADRIVLTSIMDGDTIEQDNPTQDDAGRYVFKAQEVTPQNMTEQISLELNVYNANGEVTLNRRIEYSIQEYCESLLASTEDETLRTAIVDMLNYGAAAQEYVSKNTDRLANANISGYQALATEFNASGAKDVLAVNPGSKAQFTAVTLSLEDKVSVYARFTTSATEELTATVKIGTNDAQTAEIVKESEGAYYVICNDVAPTQYADNIIFTVSVAGAQDASCRYSVNSYIANKYNDAKCGAVVKALYSYGVGVSNYVSALNGAKPANVIKDQFFSNGLSMISPDGSVTTTKHTVNDGASPIWQVGQWDSQKNLADVEPTVNNGVYTYNDGAKELSVNAYTGSVYMAINGDVEYADGDRSQVSTPWPHLLLQQDYYGDQLINLSQMSSVNMQMTYKVTHCEDKMQSKVDAANLHCAQFVWYITIQNRTEGHAEFGQYMWFGMILYDNRDEGKPFDLTYKVDDDSTANTGKLICQPASASWSSTKKMASVGETINVDFNILGIAKTAFEYAQNEYNLFSSSSWSDMYIGSMNFGIELPGTYNVGIQIDNVGIAYTKA